MSRLDKRLQPLRSPDGRTLGRLKQVIRDPGPSPSHHYRTMQRHRREWPALWKVIDELLEEG